MTEVDARRSASASPKAAVQDEGPYFHYIDGLRAISILLVFAFHLNGGVAHGYIGVDVFFVVSGFVVTLSLQRQRGAPLDQIAAFLMRRARRLLPAFFLMLLVAMLAAGLLISPGQFFRNIVPVGSSAALGIANWTLIVHAQDYFGVQAELNPFTHTWSLGVEEQFYFFFAPIAIILGLKRYNFLFAALVAVSFLYWISAKDAHQFYATPARFWELGLGVLTALYASRVSLSGPVRSVLGAAGAAIIAVASWYGPDLGASPIVLSCFGAVAVILSNGQGWIGQVLASPASTYIGRLSYSMYLWHWPIIVLGKWTIGVEPVPHQVALVSLTLVCSMASYHFVELPLRRAEWPFLKFSILRDVAVVFVLGATVWLLLDAPLKPRELLILLTIGGLEALISRLSSSLHSLGTARITAALAAANRHPMASVSIVVMFAVLFWGAAVQYGKSTLRYAPDPRVPIAFSNMPPVNDWGGRPDCHYQQSKDLQALIARCLSKQEGERTIFLIGDSHALHLGFGLRRMIREGFSPFDQARIMHANGVPDMLNQGAPSAEISFALAQSTPGDVIAVTFYRGKLSPTRRIAHLSSDPFASKVTRERLSNLERALSTLEKKASSEGVSILLIDDSPRLAIDVEVISCLVGRQLTGSDPCKTPKSQSLHDRAPMTRLFKKLAAQSDTFVYWDYHDLICPGDFCVAQRADGTITMIDYNHISRRVSEEISVQIGEFLHSAFPK